MSEHAIDALLNAARRGENLDIPAGWGQGRTTYGGLVAAVLAARAIGASELDPVTLRALTTNFLAPVVVGPARVSAEILRRGSSATQVEVRIEQPDDAGATSLRAVALATFGTPRESAVDIRPAALSELPDPAAREPWPYVEGLMPEFMANVEFRQFGGQLPFSGAPNGDVTGYMRFAEPTGGFDVEHLVALIDAWAPAPSQMLTSPAMMSTMTWTLELVAPLGDVDPAARWWYEVTTDAAHGGYGHSEARVFTDDGRPVAISRQTIALFG